MVLLAGSRGRGRFGWLIISLVVSPLVAFIILLLIRNVKAEEEKELALFREQARWQTEQENEERRHQQVLLAISRNGGEGALSLNKEGGDSDSSSDISAGKLCQFCGSPLKKEAIICKYCDKIVV